MKLLIAGIMGGLLLACGAPQEAPDRNTAAPATNLSVTTAPFGTTDAGDVSSYTLTNTAGASVSLLNFGGVITHIRVPDRDGELADVTLGFDDLADYQAENPYFGAFIGRYGNRIAKGRFTLDGKRYELPVNNGPNSLHGGTPGFDKRYWIAETLEKDDRVGLRLSGTSPDGDQGYPGNLTVAVTYWWDDTNTLTLDYEATTDAPTPVNLTNHAYFNLRGAESGADILDHELMINADAFTPVDETLIPTGEIAPVADTPFDFTSPKPIGRDIGVEKEQLAFGGGYDHNFLLKRDGAAGLVLAATVYEPTSGRTLEVRTEEPGVQFYSGNFLDGTNVGKGGTPYEFRTGFCLETQHFPDSPNQEGFPSTILRPGDSYSTTTTYTFGVR